MSTRESIIYYAKPPEFIDTHIIPNLKEFLLENKHLSILTEEDINNNIRIEISGNHNEKDWFAVANADVRIVPTKGCDRIAVNSIKSIFVRLNLFYKDTFMLYVKVTYDSFNERYIIDGDTVFISKLDSLICSECRLPNKECTCHVLRHSQGSTDTPMFETLGDKIIPINTFFFKDDNQLFQEIEREEDKGPQINFAKYDELLNAIVIRFKIRKTEANALNERMRTIVKKNPEISDEELTRQLLSGM